MMQYKQRKMPRIIQQPVCEYNIQNEQQQQQQQEQPLEVVDNERTNRNDLKGMRKDTCHRHRQGKKKKETYTLPSSSE